MSSFWCMQARGIRDQVATVKTSLTGPSEQVFAVHSSSKCQELRSARPGEERGCPSLLRATLLPSLLPSLLCPWEGPG